MEEVASEIEQLIVPSADGIQPTEWRRIHRRRFLAGQAESDRGEEASPERPENLVGLALSGGGIRSAIFSLGLVQGLYRCGVLRAAAMPTPRRVRWRRCAAMPLSPNCGRSARRRWHATRVSPSVNLSPDRGGARRTRDVRQGAHRSNAGRRQLSWFR